MIHTYLYKKIDLYEINSIFIALIDFIFLALTIKLISQKE